MSNLVERFNPGRTIAAPGVFDAASALLAEQAGFEVLFLSGSALSYTGLGRPDIGLITATELVDATARICDRVAVPLLVDVDGGLGGVAHVDRLVRQLDRAGAAAVQIEDQAEVKPGHALTSRPLVTVETMVGKIKAAQDGRLRDDFLVSARTDAAVSADIDEALRRAEAYVQAGCDLLFVEGVKRVEDLTRIGRMFGDQVFLVHNIFKGSASPVFSTAELADHRFALGLFSGAIVSTMIKAARDMLHALKAGEDLRQVADRMLDNTALTETVGVPAFLARFAKGG